MPFVRVHGNQLALVHGSRREGKVVQEVLFTLYSKEEAREAIGQGSEGGDWHFQRLISDQHPKITFDWSKIREEISSKLEQLPEVYDHGEARLGKEFREALVGFTRQLLLADPQDHAVAREVIQENREALQFLKDWLDWRMERAARADLPAGGAWDNPFLWQFTAHRERVSHEAEDEIRTLYEKGEYDRLVPRLLLLTEAFPEYADGHNFLGLVALEQDQLDEAIFRFQKTVEGGRTRLPRRVQKRLWWGLLSTRDYMRGLANLALALNRAGRYGEALGVCDELAKCNDPDGVAARRAMVYLNLGRYEEAADSAATLVGHDSSSRFELGFALLSAGRESEAMPHLARAVAAHPRAARRIVGARLPRATNYDEGLEDRLAMNSSRDLHEYFRRERARVVARLRALLKGVTRTLG